MSSFFFFNDTATTEIYTLSLHDALPIYAPRRGLPVRRPVDAPDDRCRGATPPRGGGRDRATAPRGRLVHHRFVDLSDRHGRLDRKSTRLNSSHGYISYAVFCLKKKKKQH